MRRNALIIILIALVIAFAAILYYFNNKETGGYGVLLETPGKETPKKTGETVLPKATGNFDDAINAILKEIDVENTDVLDITDEKNIITSDIQGLSDFSQAANENEY